MIVFKGSERVKPGNGELLLTVADGVYKKGATTPSKSSLFILPKNFGGTVLFDEGQHFAVGATFGNEYVLKIGITWEDFNSHVVARGYAPVPESGMHYKPGLASADNVKALGIAKAIADGRDAALGEVSVNDIHSLLLDEVVNTFRDFVINRISQMDAIVEEIAKKYFQVETMKTRNSDEKDFYDVAIWDIKEALSEAFKRGKR